MLNNAIDHSGGAVVRALIIVPAVGWTSASAVHRIPRRRWWTALRLSTLRCRVAGTMIKAPGTVRRRAARLPLPSQADHESRRALPQCRIGLRGRRYGGPILCRRGIPSVLAASPGDRDRADQYECAGATGGGPLFRNGRIFPKRTTGRRVAVQRSTPSTGRVGARANLAGPRVAQVCPIEPAPPLAARTEKPHNDRRPAQLSRRICAIHSCSWRRNSSAARI